MPDQPSPIPANKFKAEMPHIPGVSTPAVKPRRSGRYWLIVVGLFAVAVAVVAGTRIFSKSRKIDSPPAAQIDVPSPVPDLSASLPTAREQDPVIGTVSELKPWGSKRFTFHNTLTGENVPALLLRLPTASATQSSAYWAFAMKPAYGTCQLEYIEDLQKLTVEYSYRQARHPMIGNPCTRSLYDPLKYAAIPGNVLARGAIVQGSDLRPPLGIEIKLKGKDLLAVRME
jgi:hypothetical protein